MVIDVITERNRFVFLRFPGTTVRDFQKVFALRSKKLFQMFYNRFSFNPSPPSRGTFIFLQNSLDLFMLKIILQKQTSYLCCCYVTITNY